MPTTIIPLNIRSGVPFTFEFVVTLPSGRSWWTDISQFEILAQIRDLPAYTSRLQFDLSKFFTVTLDAPDAYMVRLFLTGEQTRLITRSGYYDVIMSDVGTTDARAEVLLAGQVLLNSVVTAAKEATGVRSDCG